MQSSYALSTQGTLSACVFRWAFRKWVMMETLLFSFLLVVGLAYCDSHCIRMWMWSHCWFDQKNMYQSTIAKVNSCSFSFCWGLFLYLPFWFSQHLELSNSCFSCTFCRKWKWDLGRSKDLFILEIPMCQVLSPLSLPKWRQKNEGFICRKVLPCILGWPLREWRTNKLPLNSACLH